MPEATNVSEYMGELIEDFPMGCVICNAPITGRVVNAAGKRIVIVKTCPAHTLEEPEPVSPIGARDLKAEWEKICPPQFLDTNPARIPDEILRQFRGYGFSNVGILAVGPTGTWKSRSMHLLLRRLFYEGRRVKLLDGPLLAMAISDSFSEDQAPQKRYTPLIEYLTQVDCLSIDDFDKAKITERVQEGFWTIIDHRAKNKKPTFITMNQDGDSFEARFDANVGKPLRQRLKTCCTLIQTKPLSEYKF